MLDNIYAYIIKLAVKEYNDGTFYVSVPGLKGIHVGGNTKEEAIEKAIKDIQGILKIRLERGKTLPESENIIAIRQELEEPISLNTFPKNSFLFPVPAYLATQLIDRESRL